MNRFQKKKKKKWDVSLLLTFVVSEHTTSAYGSLKTLYPDYSETTQDCITSCEGVSRARMLLMLNVSEPGHRLVVCTLDGKRNYVNLSNL